MRRDGSGGAGRFFVDVWMGVRQWRGRSPSFSHAVVVSPAPVPMLLWPPTVAHPFGPTNSNKEKNREAAERTDDGQITTGWVGGFLFLRVDCFNRALVQRTSRLSGGWRRLGEAYFWGYLSASLLDTGFYGLGVAAQFKVHCFFFLFVCTIFHYHL
jgi:hypothetical protein